MAEPHMLKLVLHWTGYGEEGTISWHFKGNAGAHTPTELSDAAGNVIAEWQSARTPSSKTGFCALITAAQSADSVTLYEYAVSKDPITGKLAHATALGGRAITGWTGTSALRAPLQSALVATVRTPLAGASHRGRQYFPGQGLELDPANACVINVDTDKVALLAANMGPEAAGAIASSLAIASLDWAVYSLKLDTMTVVTQIGVDNKMDTQRRRERQLQATHTQLVSA